MKDIILGINSAYHESSVCLMINDQIVSAIEEERLSRIKHAKEAKIDNPDELPVLSLNKCLEMGGVQLKDVDKIGFSFNPDRRLESREDIDPFEEGNWGSVEGELSFRNKLMEVPQKLRQLGFEGEFVFMNHALAHAASCYYPSGFEDAAILTIDGIGEVESTTLYHANGKEIKEIEQIKYPHSMGFLWEKMAKFLGYSEYDACKIMSIASFGNPERYREAFKQIVTINEENTFELNSEALLFRVEDYSKLESIFGVKKREFDDNLDQEHMDIAATLQELTTEIVLLLVNKLYSLTGSKNICLAGGVALNCVTNRIVFEESEFENIFIQPAANDAGTALGAALKLSVERNEPSKLKQKNTYLGPSFEEFDVNELTKDKAVSFERPENLEAKVAQLLTEGKIIGWFQGRMEFGPRALGNRSLLADPRSAEMNIRINRIVKHREDHRPFCPSVLAGHEEEWFSIEKPGNPSEYMLMAYPVIAEKKDLIPAVVHVDGTARIQVVKEETNKRYHTLISEFNKLTGVPLLLNTSFNDREPIVCTPEQALKTFLKSKIDFLVIEDYLFSKES